MAKVNRKPGCNLSSVPETRDERTGRLARRRAAQRALVPGYTSTSLPKPERRLVSKRKYQQSGSASSLKLGHERDPRSEQAHRDAKLPFLIEADRQKHIGISPRYRDDWRSLSFEAKKTAIARWKSDRKAYDKARLSAEFANAA